MSNEMKRIISDLCFKAKLSQSKLAQILQVTPSTISFWIVGMRSPKIDTCYKIITLARQYGMELTLESLKPRSNK